ncbi:DUF4390 domain-containing protein [Chitinimonas arctica]|uniref:DUF4390 domain-containing protein n=1 Tax=Chitinimonas arctica TaxID=2594795 RepID=A0A516SG89_9NEIS|nr:DUF4390 domain-containing protein [Chitinimonas arctica]QDQ27179.1 DUF4390 domain-containing protein [Chitinimonas arctica]
MAFFTRCLPRIEPRCLLVWLCAAICCLPLWAGGGIQLESAAGVEHEGKFSLDARFLVTLDAIQENALLAGVPLTFSVEFTLTRPRWYWAWRRVADWFDPTARIEYKLSYHALTRSYRVSVGTLYQSFDTLDGALHSLGVIRDWSVAERGAVSRRLDSRFAGELQMRLDTSKLPKPLQLSLLGEADWKLESDPLLVEFVEAK